MIALFYHTNAQFIKYPNGLSVSVIESGEWDENIQYDVMVTKGNRENILLVNGKQITFVKNVGELALLLNQVQQAHLGAETVSFYEERDSLYGQIAIGVVKDITEDIKCRRGLKNSLDDYHTSQEQLYKLHMEMTVLLLNTLGSGLEKTAIQINSLIKDALLRISMFSNEWNQVDEDIQVEIETEWVEIIQGYLNKIG